MPETPTTPPQSSNSNGLPEESLTPLERMVRRLDAAIGALPFTDEEMEQEGMNESEVRFVPRRRFQTTPKSGESSAGCPQAGDSHTGDPHTSDPSE
jgi:hypothetical protein